MVLRRTWGAEGCVGCHTEAGSEQVGKHQWARRSQHATPFQGSDDSSVTIRDMEVDT